MKKKWIWIVAVILVALALVFLADGKGTAFNHVLRNQEKLTEYAELCLDRPEAATRYRNWNTYRNNDYDVVLFQVSYVGFGSQSDETGFYYSPEDAAVGLGNGLEEEYSDTGVKFLGEGDNYTYVEKITDCWYWYERHW